MYLGVEVSSKTQDTKLIKTGTKDRPEEVVYSNFI